MNVKIEEKSKTVIVVEINRIIGENVKKLRELNKMTLYDLYVQTNISQPTISAIESGRPAKIEYLLKICAVFGVSLQDIIPSEAAQFPKGEEQSSAYSALKDISNDELKSLEKLLDSNALPLLKVIIPLKTAMDELEEDNKETLKNIIYSIIENDHKNTGSQG
ncbi:anaerobic benzoate catabolism transcriptional regulator [compost metagenome]